ncbi:MAG: YggS family pyridoxal phosphate-dependent enzyme [Acidobacteria bacterium]|nr:YggS family pyridoxal phosphate-dependent enzyme [Acidobacteriota bacterium]
MIIADRIWQLREQIKAAAQRAHRNSAEISLMAVSKTFPAAAIRTAYDAGVRLFGENRVQEFSGKAQELGALAGVEWHLIGHLQSNKAARAVELFHAIDSVDSIRLARKLNQVAGTMEKRLPVLIEVNIGGEHAKSGVLPESQEFNQLLELAPELPWLEFSGLMTIPPYHADPVHSRPYFRQLRECFERVQKRHLPALSMRILSMGMSYDFPIAIEEGATCIRLGTAIFGDRAATGSHG